MSLALADSISGEKRAGYVASDTPRQATTRVQPHQVVAKLPPRRTTHRVRVRQKQLQGELPDREGRYAPAAEQRAADLADSIHTLRAQHANTSTTNGGDGLAADTPLRSPTSVRMTAGGLDGTKIFEALECFSQHSGLCVVVKHGGHAMSDEARRRKLRPET